jgi:hypothetical protein
MANKASNTTTSAPVPVPASSEKKLSRDEIRQRIFSAENKQKSSRIIHFGGVDIELRQPSVRETLALGDSMGNDRIFLVNFLIQYAYVPRSEEKIFDPADYDMLADLPFGKDMSEASRALRELTDIVVADEAKNSSGNLSASTR